MGIHFIDIAIVVGYFVIVLIIGFSLMGEVKNSEDYFLAGRSQKWYSIGFSLFASNISSTTLIGLCGAGYLTGVSISAYEWMAAPILVFFAIYFIPYYLGTKIFTLPEFLEKRFDIRTRYYFSGLTIFGNIFIDTAGTLFAGALAFKYFFPWFTYIEAATLLALFAAVYTVAGGLKAVIVTDVIQAIILLIGSIIITVLSYYKAGGWEHIVSNTPHNLLSIVQPLNDSTMPWLGLLIGVPILGFYFWGTNQFIVQRVLAAKNIHHARWGALFGGFLKLPVLFLMVLPGIFARQFFPGEAIPDAIFPKMINELLPIGIKGIVLAGFVAAIMSSIDSTLHSASTLVTMDFLLKFKKKLTQKKITFYGRIITVSFMLFSILWVPVISSFQNLFAYLQSALAYLVPPVAAVFLLGLFWKKATSSSAFYGLIIGHIFSITYFILLKLGLMPDIHFLMMAGVFFFVTFISMIIISFISKEPSAEQIEKYTWSKERMKILTADLPKVSFWIDYRFLSVILLGLTAALIIMFW